MINDFNLLLLAFKVKNNLIKNNVILTYVNEVHQHGTRQSLSGTFYVVTHDTKYGQADFYRRGLIKFNELQIELKVYEPFPLLNLMSANTCMSNLLMKTNKNHFEICTESLYSCLELLT